MPTTPQLALRYPANTDRVADGALAIQHLAEDVEARIRPFKFRGRQIAGGQVIPTGTAPVTITIDTEDDDPQGMHPAGSSGSVTIPAGGDGLYVVHGHVSYAASVTGNRNVALYKNGVALFGSNNTVPGYGTNTNTTAAGTVLAQLVAGDVITLGFWQTSGANMNTTNATLGLARVGA